MNIFQRKKIDNAVNEFIIKYKLSLPILDVESVIKAIGGQVVYVRNFDELQKGKIKFANRTYIIRTGAIKSTFSKNVSLGMSLGHIILHMTKNKVLNSHTEYYEFTSMEDDEAIYFMYALLMPKNEYTLKLSQLANDNGDVNFVSMSRYFHVPVTMIIERGKQLHLLMETI